MVDGPTTGLAILEALDEDQPRVDQVRAHLHELAGDLERAALHYRRAAARATNRAERRELDAQVARLTRR
jgi:predicted RNA polymerase sigma factor